MAIIKRGILGGVQNKIGNVVGSSWKGIATLRSLPLSVANPKTAAQTAVRSKFSIASKMGSQILVGLIKPLWDRFAQQESGYNAWIRSNLPFIDANGDIAVTDIVMSKGTLVPSPVISASIDETAEEITLSWTPDPGGDSSPLDVPYIVVMEIGADVVPRLTTVLPTATRGGGGYNYPFFPDPNAISTVLWLSFKKPDGTKVSNSEYSSVTIIP